MFLLFEELDITLVFFVCKEKCVGKKYVFVVWGLNLGAGRATVCLSWNHRIPFYLVT